MVVFDPSREFEDIYDKAEAAKPRRVESRG